VPPINFGLHIHFDDRLPAASRLHAVGHDLPFDSSENQSFERLVRPETRRTTYVGKSVQSKLLPSFESRPVCRIKADDMLAT
jgi:hypothetical protein